MAAEVPLGHPAVLGPVEQGAPALELVDPFRCLLGVELGHPPVVQHLAAAHRVAEVDLPVVLRVDVAHRRGHAALGHHRVGLAEQRLADEGHPQPALLGLDRRPQPGAAGADHDHVVLVRLVLGHLFSGSSRPRRLAARPTAPRPGLEVEARVVERPGGDQPDVGSVRATKTRLAQANFMWLALRGVTSFQSRCRIGCFGEVLQLASAEVPAGVARQAVAPQERGVDAEDRGAEADAPAGRVARLAEGHDRVDRQDHVEGQAEVEEPPVDVLQDQRQARSRRCSVSWPSATAQFGGENQIDR